LRRYLGRFLFSGEEVFQTVGSLSGGEKSRVALAKLMLAPANLLVLDEPTNHLDIPAREVLESALADYPGTLLLVSHDRYFLDRIITRLLYLRDGVCTSYTGNYSAYQAYLATQTQAQEQLKVAQKVTKKIAPAPQTAPRPRQRPGKRRKPGVIEHEISQVEAELAALQSAFEHEQHRTDWQRLTELSTQQGAAAARLESLLEEWEASMATEEGRAR
jgi:ATP-binding cassette subfamily F protein 3